MPIRGWKSGILEVKEAVFFEKKNQKTFFLWRLRVALTLPQALS
jgi:hypothetical protein